MEEVPVDYCARGEPSVEGTSHTAHEVGRYTLQGEGGQVLDMGKYVVIGQ